MKIIRLTENDVIKGCLNGKADCQRMLFDAYAGKLMSVCLRYAANHHDAEDILQEAFIKIFAHIHQFKFEGSFEGWLRRITVNTALKAVQKKKLHFTEITDHTPCAACAATNAQDALQAVHLLKMLNNLPHGYRIIFNLYVIEGYSHDEIAEMLNIQTSTSRSQLVKARKMLQQQIILMEKIAV